MLLTLGPDVDLDTLSDTVGTAVAVDAAVTETSRRTVTIVATKRFRMRAVGRMIAGGTPTSAIAAR